MELMNEWWEWRGKGPFEPYSEEWKLYVVVK